MVRFRDKLIPIDFEYHSSEEPNLHLVCCSLKYKGKIYEYWLNDNNYNDTDRLNRHLKRINREGFIICAFNATAEGRAILSMCLDVRQFNWVCLNAEWKMITNHNHKYQYGDQYIDGKIVKTQPPKNKYSMSEEQIKHSSFAKAKHNLLACTYKMTGRLERDSEYKDKMRDIILTKDYDLIEKNKKEIQAYCSSDIDELEEIAGNIFDAYDDYMLSHVNRFGGQVTASEILYRGETMARAAIIMQSGYPVDVKKLTKFSQNIPHIMRDLIEDINSQFDWELFSPSKNNAHGYKQNQKEWKKYISESAHASGWLRTDKGDFSLSLDAFEKSFSFRHDYPRGNFYAQALRYLKTKQALNGFNTGSKKTIFDDLGSDNRIRAYINPYGSQSARYQPPSTSFLFLKPAWTRTLVHPSSGNAICGIDYKSEEALIGALLSNDKAMIEAYASGDVYLDFAKRAGAVPPGGTKSQYKKERDLFKSTYLGISYLMGPESLAKKLTGDTGKKHTKEDAKMLIEAFYSAYPDYKRYLDEVYNEYIYRGYHKLFDGWVMFGDNDNYRSVSNLPIQGMGSCILRAAIKRAQDHGLDVVIPLHDALYINYPSGDLSHIDLLAESMEQAFLDCFPNNSHASLIKLDIEAWSDDYRSGNVVTPKRREVKTETIHIDPRGAEEYERYKKYML